MRFLKAAGKLQEPDFNVSVRTGPPAVAIVDYQLPIDFLLPQPPKPDRCAILEALSHGAVPGALLAPSKLSPSIRSQ